MKKILCFFVLLSAISLSSCSDDDDTKRSTLTATIAGVEYRFNTFVVTKQSFNHEGFEYVDVTISATIDGNPDRMISFVVEQGVTGTEASHTFAYFENETAHLRVPASFTFNVEESGDNHTKGSFSGFVEEIDIDDNPTGVLISIGNGSFDVRH